MSRRVINLEDSYKPWACLLQHALTFQIDGMLWNNNKVKCYSLHQRKRNVDVI